MFIKLSHKSLEVYKASRELVKEIYKISLQLPKEENFNLVQQIRRAALSVKLNFSEGSSRKPVVERRRYYEIARGSVVGLDAAFETAVDLNYFTEAQLEGVGTLLNKCFAMLSKMIDK